MLCKMRTGMACQAAGETPDVRDIACSAEGYCGAETRAFYATGAGVMRDDGDTHVMLVVYVCRPYGLP